MEGAQSATPRHAQEGNPQTGGAGSGSVVPDSSGRLATAAVACDIRDLALADEGKRRIEWASLTTPVLRTVRKQFIKAQPFAGIRIAALRQVTAETANLLITLRDGGAQCVLCAPSPASVQDEVAASLVRDYHIPVFGIHGDGTDMQPEHAAATLSTGPQLILDSGGALTALVHEQPEPASIIGTIEENGNGASRARGLARAGELRFPVITTHESGIRSLFDNRYGTGQSALDTIIRTTNVLIAGLTLVVAGYGPCGRGVAARARGLGANVIVTEVDPGRALQALMEGYRVVTIAEAAASADVLVTITGNRNVVSAVAFDRLKDGAMLCNAGSSDSEIDLAALARITASHREVRASVEEFKMKDGRRVYVLAGGRPVHFTGGGGLPASVVDVSFAVQALAAEHLLANRESHGKGVHPAPACIDKQIARMKLDSLGVNIDKLTIEQEQYLASWAENS